MESPNGGYVYVGRLTAFVRSGDCDQIGGMVRDMEKGITEIGGHGATRGASREGCVPPGRRGRRGDRRVTLDGCGRELIDAAGGGSDAPRAGDGLVLGPDEVVHVGLAANCVAAARLEPGMR